MSEIGRAITEIEETRFRENAFKTVSSEHGEVLYSRVKLSKDTLELVEKLLRAELEREKNPLTCDGCKESGLWDDEIEHGYNCPCMGCERNFPDRYEPKGATK